MHRIAGHCIAPVLLGAFVLVGCEAPTSPDSNDPAPLFAPEVAYKNGQARIDMCHRTRSDTNPWVKITIAQAAEDAHRGHGDLAPGEFVSPPLLKLNDACEVVEAEPPSPCDSDVVDDCAGHLPGPGDDDDDDDGVSLP